MAAERATYTGPRLRRVRRDLGLTQQAMADDLEVSVAYVSLIESNQRPLTADLLLRLARTYRIDMADFAGDGGAEATARLQKALKDPLFADIDPPALQAADVATNYPGLAEAFLRLHAAYREENRALADRRAAAGRNPALEDGDPVTEVRRFLSAARNNFPRLDEAAERLAAAIEAGGGIEAHLADRHRPLQRSCGRAAGQLRYRRPTPSPGTRPPDEPTQSSTQGREPRRRRRRGRLGPATPDLLRASLRPHRGRTGRRRGADQARHRARRGAEPRGRPRDRRPLRRHSGGPR